MTLNNEQKMELNNKLFNFFNKEIYDWVAKNFGESEADDPSWNIEALSAHLASELLKKVRGAKKPERTLTAEEAMAHIHLLITEANTLNDMGDTYIPEEKIINYLKEIM